MVNEQQLIDLKNKFTYSKLGSFNYPAYDLDFLLNSMMSCSSDDLKFREHLNMYELHRLEKYSWAPEFLLDLLHSCNQINMMKGSSIISFASEETDTGYNWHDDLFDLVVTNVVGETTWYFEDNTQIDMKPFDVMFVPKGLKHRVTGHSARFTAAIGNNNV
jgi:homogentisate 1,2-dioxygenase